MSQISVVVPVYKAEQLVSRCIDSVLSQTYQDWELILVDDGSPDRSGAICDEYARRDERVKVVHQTNGGVTAARRRGVKESCGNYVTFVDADDVLPANALKCLYEATNDRQYDIVVGRIKGLKIYHQEEINVEEYRRRCISGQGHHSGPFAKLFWRKLFNDQTFDIPRDIVKGEDMLMNIRLAFSNMKSVRFINDEVYNYVPLPQGCMCNFRNTQDYESKYHLYRLDSIPVPLRTDFGRELIETRLSALRQMAFEDINEAIRKTPFKKLLIKDIKSQHFNLRLFDRIVIYTTSPIFFRITLQWIKLCSIPRRLFRL